MKQWEKINTKKELEKPVTREPCIAHSEMSDCKAPHCNWVNNENYCENTKNIASIADIYIDLIIPGESSEKRYITPDLRESVAFENIAREGFSDYLNNIKLAVYNRKNKYYGCFVILILIFVYYLLSKLLKN